MTTNNKLPLHDLRVIDFGHYIAGPAVGMILADQGAEVICIHPPGGPRWVDQANAILGRGKKSIVLDLKDKADQQTAQALVERADILIENFRPGVMDRLGLGADILTVINPSLVYLSLPGFAASDSERASTRAYEAIVAAASGQFTDMGLSRVLMGINPSFTPLPLASAYAATLGATAALLAATAARKTGKGDRIEVPLASALMEGLVYNAMYVENYPERYKSPREREIERRRNQGEPMDMSYLDIQEYLDPFYRSYYCADGRPFYIVCASHQHHVRKAMKLMGIWDDMQAQGLPDFDAYLAVSEWPEGQTCSLTSYPFSPDWAQRISSAMKQVFKTRSAFEWEQVWGEAGIPAAAHRTTKEWMTSEHAQVSGLVVEVDDPQLGVIRQMGNVAWLASSAEAVMQKSPAPQPDADREAILAILNEQPRSAGKDNAGEDGWLNGVKILDLTNVIAGPTIASTLARFGAEVISLSTIEPSMDPWNTVIFGFQAGRGKRSMLCDLKTTEGQQILSRLLADIDVITFNGLERQLGGLGLDAERLKEINPGVVLCLFDAFGGPAQGPRSNYPGYDDLVQASIGVMTRFGGGLETPEEHAHLGTIDVLGGFASALAISVALFQRQQTGSGDVARASLAAAGQLIQLPFMIDYPGRQPLDEPAGREVKGWGPLYHCYEASDGWFFLVLEEQGLPHLVEICAIKVGSGDEELQNQLADCFIKNTTSFWSEKLQTIGAAVMSLATLQELREENLAIESEASVDISKNTYSFVRHDQHPSGRSIDIVAPNAIRPQRAKISIPSPARKYGIDTRSILDELGFDDREIELLFEKKVVSESWSEAYLPE
ncbi:MAG: CoA transferase [Gammaproteobacteria bacterium]|nr:CoA transferase [Gammaproteobacteria bacterium]